VEQGIVLAIILSVVDHLRRSYKPTNGVITPAPSGVAGHFQVDPVTPEARTAPGLIVYRFNASLYYANSNMFLDEISRLISSTSPDKLRVLCIDAAGVADIDYSAAETLRQVHDVATAHGVRITFAELLPKVRDELEHFGLLELFGADSVYDTALDALNAYRAGGAPD
jgi:sulfate permease, SulP family